MKRPLSQPQRLLAALLVFAAVVLAGCGFSTEGGSGGGSNDPETEGITLYSGRIPAAIGPAIDSYEAEADRDVKVRFAETADLAATLVEEGDASPADVFFAQEPGAIAAVAEAGLLTKLPQNILDMVPARYRDPEGRWVGVTGRARVIAYNKTVVSESELPPSPFGLTAPKWKDRVGWSPASSSMQEYVTALRARYGDDRTKQWLEEMVDNGAVSFPDNVTIRDAIAKGEIDVGLINHYYVAEAIAEEGPDYPVAVYFPPGGLGSLMLLTSVGVLESSDRKPEAFAFVRSLLSKKSQAFFTSSSKEYPLAKGGKPDPALSVPIERDPRLGLEPGRPQGAAGDDRTDAGERGAVVLGARPARRGGSVGAGAIVGLAAVLPAAYLAVVVFGDFSAALETALSSRTLATLLRTAELTTAVVLTSIAIALPIGWLTVRTDLPGRRLWAVLCTLPLVIPSYVGAYLLVAALGPNGMVQEALGVDRLPSIYGFTGAWLVLTLFTYPLLLIPLRATLRRIDPQLEDAARAMGRSPLEVFRTVVLPQLWPVIAAGSLLVALFTISDFGAVSILRFRSFTSEIYIAYQSSFDRVAAAALGAVLVVAMLGPALRQLAGARLEGRPPAGAGDAAPGAALPARPLALAGARLLLADRPGRLRPAGRGAGLLGEQRDLHRQHLAEHDRGAGRQLAADRGLGGGDRGDRGAGGGGAGGPLPLAGGAAGRTALPRRLRAAGDPRRPRPRLLRHPGGAGALPDDRAAGLRDDDPLPAAGDRADRQRPGPALAADRRGGARDGTRPGRGLPHDHDPARPRRDDGRRRARLPARDEGADRDPDPLADRVQNAGDGHLDPDHLRLLRGERDPGPGPAGGGRDPGLPVERAGRGAAVIG